MTIPIKDQKMLWGRAAGRCSIPTCRNPLVEDETETDDPAIIGENCHIIGEKEDAARGVNDMALEERNSYANLILCCRNHHAVIDKQPEKYTVEELHKIKSQHEAWIGRLDQPDPAKERDDQYYGEVVDHIATHAHFDSWLALSSHVLSHGQPKLERALDDELHELRRWLARRPPWPGRYPQLESAILNFARVLEDFQETFRAHASLVGNGEWLLTEKFYKIREWDEARYNRLATEYDFHVDLVQDLMVELTRAANLIIESVRKFISPTFMRHEGDLMFQTGPNMILQWDEVVARYSDDDKKASPIYPGLKAFLTHRATRDYHFGKSDRAS